MLPKIIDEWNQAQSKQVVSESRESAPGKVIYQKSVIEFRGAKLELTLSAVDDSVGIDVDRPESFTRRLTALNTNRNVEITPTLEGMTTADVYSAILEAINPEARAYEYKALSRNKNHKKSLFKDTLSVWKDSLSSVGYSDEDTNYFINYCTSEMKKVKHMHSRCDAFINTLAKYKNEITDTEPCADFGNETNQGVFYNEIALYLAKKFTITTDDGATFDTLPHMYIQDHLIKEDYDGRLPSYILKIKNILRDIYQMCDEKVPNFCFVLTSLGAYFERITKESAAFRYAAILERKEAERKRRFMENKKPFFNKNRSDSNKPKNQNENTTERPKKPFKPNKPKVKPKTDNNAASISFNPLGNDMFAHALKNAKPLK